MIDVLLLSFFLIFLILVIVRMDQNERKRNQGGTDANGRPGPKDKQS